MAVFLFKVFFCKTFDMWHFTCQDNLSYVIATVHTFSGLPFQPPAISTASTNEKSKNYSS